MLHHIIIASGLAWLKDWRFWHDFEATKTSLSTIESICHKSIRIHISTLRIQTWLENPDSFASYEPLWLVQGFSYAKLQFVGVFPRLFILYTYLYIYIYISLSLSLSLRVWFPNSIGDFLAITMFDATPLRCKFGTSLSLCAKRPMDLLSVGRQYPLTMRQYFLTHHGAPWRAMRCKISKGLRSFDGWLVNTWLKYVI